MLDETDGIQLAYIGMMVEMAQPSDTIKNMTFYHGTHREDFANKIMSDGYLKPSETINKSSLTPVLGAAYVTPHIHYAQIYALGGDTAGRKHRDSDIEKYGRYGHVFKVSGEKLKDVQPDEDSIGEMIGNKKGPNWLHSLANKHVSSGTISKARDGEYSAYARIGKNLVNKMTDSQKLELITHHGAHVANLGKIEPDEVYRIDKTKQHLLKPDGSNFFDHAERIK